MLKKLSAVLFLFVVAGCMAKIPQNPQEAREIIPTSALYKGEKKQFSVNGNYSKTVQRLKKLSYACLNKTVQGSRSTMMSQQVYKYSYKPTVKIGDKKTEMYLQYDPGGLKLYDEPDGGGYILIVDVFNRGNGKMDVDMYRSNWYDTSIDAVESWIKGTDDMCPEL